MALWDDKFVRIVMLLYAFALAGSFHRAPEVEGIGSVRDSRPTTDHDNHFVPVP